MLLPFYERSWMDNVDITTIVGASGASILPASTAPLSLWREFAAERGWVAGYIQLSPFTVLDELRHESGLVINNANFLLELPIWEIFSSASRTIQEKIRSGEKAKAILVDNPEALAEDLIGLYSETMARINARSHFHFSSETIVRWAVDPESMVLGAAIENVIQAVCMFRIVGHHAEAHIVGTSEHGRALTAWLIWKGTQRLIGYRVRLLNLGGGVRAGDGVYRFKERFNGLSRPRGALWQIYDRPKYHQLSARSGTPVPHDWFPAYRSSHR
jgi:hypothetical protein